MFQSSSLLVRVLAWCALAVTSTLALLYLYGLSAPIYVPSTGWGRGQWQQVGSGSEGVGGAGRWCHFGTLPAVWVSNTSELPHWHILDPGCRLQDLLSQWGDWGGSSAQRSAAVGENARPMEPTLHVVDRLSPHGQAFWQKVSQVGRGDGGSNGAGDGDSAHTHRSESLSTESTDSVDGSSMSKDELKADVNSTAPPPSTGIMFISDSVDRYVMTYMCEHLGGKLDSFVLSWVLKKSFQGHNLDELSDNLKSGYSVNTCRSPTSIRLASTYIPGVHPTGPFHLGRNLSFRERIDHAADVWASYSSREPDIVVVAACLWDMARLSHYEPHLLADVEVPVQVLEAWQSNYTRVVQHAQKAFPKASLFMYHPIMLPKFNATTGVMQKSYLGRRVHVEQFNTAGMQAASSMGLEVLDYEKMGRRFMEGQEYLTDLIHPSKKVGLEIGNMYLNYAAALQSARKRRHTSRRRFGR